MLHRRQLDEHTNWRDPLDPSAWTAPSLEWIEVAQGAPYFCTETGKPWTPVGHNDAITWPTLNGLFRRRGLSAVDAHLGMLAAHGVTCLRLMLEYAHTNHRFVERPIGRFVPAMVQLWDDLFALCGRHGLRILLTPFDTFWTWKRWDRHPYNRRNGGILGHPSRLLLCPETRAAIKRRLSFAAERWGGSGVLFAWDLWNEIHPGHAEESADCFGEFIHDLSTHVRELEQKLYGRSHPQTVSLFGPEITWRPTMPLREPIFRHPDLDFATIHIYQQGTIDNPRDTVAPAKGMAQIVHESIAEIEDGRPFLDSEHGPIHSFKDRRKTLPAAFDDEYFRHMQWAHLACGGAGGGMRWPNRKPHVLTPGMHNAQAALSAFLPLIDWPKFKRKPLAGGDLVQERWVAAFGCADERQAVVWLLRTDCLTKAGTLDPNVAPRQVAVSIPALADGRYAITLWDTRKGCAAGVVETTFAADGPRCLAGIELVTDLALAIRRIEE